MCGCEGVCEGVSVCKCVYTCVCVHVRARAGGGATAGQVQIRGNRSARLGEQPRNPRFRPVSGFTPGGVPGRHDPPSLGAGARARAGLRGPGLHPQRVG